MSQPTENPSARVEADQWLRTALVERLESEGADDLARQLRCCGEELMLVCTNCGTRRLGHTQCKRRWCPSCSRSISARRVQRFAQGVQLMQWPLSIMLSHKNEESAAAVLTTLMPAFKRFRRTKIWKENVKGGLVSYEVTNRFGSWHDHLHCLVDCRWLALETPEPRRNNTTKQNRALFRRAKKELTAAWASCLSQETAITWVDRASGGRLMEHVKYAVKPADLLKAQGRIAPLLRALKGRRLVQPFGTLYGLSKNWKAQDNERKAACTCESCKQSGTMLPEVFLQRDLERSKKGRSTRLIK